MREPGPGCSATFVPRSRWTSSEETKGGEMANPAPVGSDVQAGTYRCTNCGYELGIQSVESLPPCPKCEGPQQWEAVTGGDSV